MEGIKHTAQTYFFAAFRAANFFALAPLVVLPVAFVAAFFVFVLFVPFCGSFTFVAS